jgi:hypothetical protein
MASTSAEGSLGRSIGVISRTVDGRKSQKIVDLDANCRVVQVRYDAGLSDSPYRYTVDLAACGRLERGKREHAATAARPGYRGYLKAVEETYQATTFRHLYSEAMERSCEFYRGQFAGETPAGAPVATPDSTQTARAAQ